MKRIDANYYPGFVRKCITFTIDDGNVPLDLKFLGYTEPAGLRGTFNLSTPLRYPNYHITKDDYRRIYKNYEISNHCRYHAYPICETRPIEIKNELFDAQTADRNYGYLTEEEGIYRIYTYNWCYMADDKRFMECAQSAQDELEDVFGKRVRGFVWPCGEQNNPEVKRMLTEKFGILRKTGNIKDSSGFALPTNRAEWSYNVNYECMTEIAQKYDEYPDDGELKFFCFGVHSHDFEKAGRWDVLEDFCKKYGNRPNDFWYAGVHEIFDYEDAVKALRITENEIKNDSDVTLYLKIDGKETILPGHQSIRF